MIRPSSTESALRTAIVLAGDFLICFGSLAAVVHLRRHVPLAFTRSLLPPENLLLTPSSIFLFATAFLLGLATAGFYRRRVMPAERPSLLVALLIQVALIAVGGAALEREIPRTVILGVLILEAIALPLWRRLLRILLPIRPRATILVGEAEEVRHALEGLVANADQRVRIIGWVGPSSTADLVIPWLGEESDPAVQQQLREVKEVIYAPPPESPSHRLELLRIRGPRGFLLLASPADALISVSTMGWIGDRPLIEVSIPCAFGLQGMIKRALDITLGALLLLLTLPVTLPIAAAIWLDTGGAIFIRQPRVGLFNVPFRMWKFRSMDAQRQLTRTGRILRRYHLDEIPQLLNVLSGEMSLVGPRPEQPDIVERILRDLPEFELRCLVRPGIAGLAQVFANYDSRPEVKLRYDLSYMCRWSLLLDLRLLFASVAASFSGSGR